MIVLKSKRVLTGGEIKEAEVIIEHDYIVDIVPFGSSVSTFNLGDLLIVPGFVDLHSDAVEKEIEPRPGAQFPIDNALIELDKKLAMAGITTMFHAIAFYEKSLKNCRSNETASTLIKEITQANRDNLSIDNLIHARYEITSFSSLSVIKKLIEDDCVNLLSLMDHSPGQGQFKTLEKWKAYHIPEYDLKDEDVSVCVEQISKNRQSCHHYLEDLTDFAKKHQIPVASHDDDTLSKIDMMAKLGISIAEFPLNIETAIYARSSMMATGMGAPNIVRGKSQSGNISARSLIREECCDFLCSDYHPSSLLQAVYVMHKELGMDLARAFSFITSTPAQIISFTDRGQIAPNKLADIVVIDDSMIPRVVLTLKSGTPIYNSSSCLCFHQNAA